MEQNYLDHHLDDDFVPIAIWIILIHILGGLRCNDDRIMNNNVMHFVVWKN